MRVLSVHTNVDGEQITDKKVVLEDALGQKTTYRFRRTANGYDETAAAFEYLGKGEPSERALEALEEHLQE